MKPRRMIFSLPFWLCLVLPALGADKPMVVELWPGKAPEETDNIGPEKVRMSPKLTRREVEITESTRLLTNVTRPTLTIYRPAKEKDSGAAVLICPGGGYWNLYWELEGEEVAAWLTSHGLTGIILKYRVPRRSDEPKDEPARRPLQDAQRAVSLVRSRAKEWNIDPKRIGIVGFSAGGHLAIATATRFQKRTYKPIDAIDKVSCRPDYAIAVYPGYLKAKDRAELVPSLRIPAGTPPIFLAHGGADIISPPEHSVVLYLALKKAGIPAELHIYAGAAHDFAVRKVDHPCSRWTEHCLDWLRNQGFLKQAKSVCRPASCRLSGCWSINLLAMNEHLVSVKRQKGAMLPSQRHQPRIFPDAKQIELVARQRQRDQDRAVVREGDEAAVEKPVVRRQDEQPIVRVQAFRVAGAAPGLDMRCRR